MTDGVQNLTAAEIIALLEAPNGRAWDVVCDQVKAARGGKYPPDWWKRVMASGLGAKVEAGWGHK